MPNYRLAVRRAAQKYGVDPTVLERQIGAESGFNPNAKSPAGAQGIAQFIPSTAKQYGVNLNDGRVTDDLEGAARYMADSLKRTGGNYHEALSIYNSGRPDGYKHIAETRNYVDKILHGVGGTSARGGSSGGRSGSSVSTTTTKTIPGVDRSDQRRALLLAYINQRGAPDALLNLKSGLDQSQDTPDRKVSTVTRTKTQGAAAQSGHGGLADFEGKKVASWIAPLLQYARAHGWKGTVTSGYRSDAEQTAIYKRGVRPAAVPKSMGGAGSNHERTGFLQGAIDVTDAGTLNTILQRKHSRLKYAGAKDPVHFSVPRNGSY